MNREALAAIWNDSSPLPIVPPEFADVLARDCGSPSQATIDWLIARGVAPLAIGSPLAIRSARVTFDKRGRFTPGALGEAFAFVIPVDDGGEVIDLVAWAPKPGLIGSLDGTAYAIGQGSLAEGDGTTGLAVTVWRSPVGWLGAGRRGLVIADYAKAAHYLAGLSLDAEDDAHAKELRRLLRTIPPDISARDRLENAA